MEHTQPSQCNFSKRDIMWLEIPYSTLHVKSAPGFDPSQLEMSNQYFHPWTECKKGNLSAK